MQLRKPPLPALTVKLSKYNVDDVALGVCKTGAEEAGVTEVRTSLSEKKFEMLHFLSLMLGSVLVLMLPLLVWLTPDLRIKKSLLKCNWTIRKRLPRCKMRLKKRLLAFSRRLHARIRKTRYMHKMRCLL